MVVVERKETLLDWSGFEGWSMVAVTERTKKKVVCGFMTKDCVIWLAAVLRSFATEHGSCKELIGHVVKEGKRWRDNQGTVAVEVCSNMSGCFAEMEISPTSKKGNRVLICFPAGKEGGGWLTVAESMARFVGVVVKEKQPQRLVGGTGTVYTVVASYANVLKGTEEVKGNSTGKKDGHHYFCLQERRERVEEYPQQAGGSKKLGSLL